MSRGRKVIVGLIVVFLAYAVITEPTASAAVVHSAFNMLLNGLSAIGDFLNALIHPG